MKNPRKNRHLNVGFRKNFALIRGFLVWLHQCCCCGSYDYEYLHY